MKEIKVALFGIGGYAANYLHAMSNPQREGVRLIGAVDPYCKQCDACPVYDTPEALFAQCQPDLAVIATPIHLHAPQAICAFEHGCDVILEKPIAPTPEDAHAILQARDKAGKRLAIGFQLCSDPAMRAAKADADAGVFGRPIRHKAIVLWPRSHTYYHRGSGWAGKKYDAQGRAIFDNVLSNATAHYLLNILYMLGQPLCDIECATFRANDIETYDTALLRGRTAQDVQVFVAVSHAIEPSREQSPVFLYEYENASLSMGELGENKAEKHVVARFKDGRVKDYGAVGQCYMAGFWNMIDAIRGQDKVACSGETALMHVDALAQMRRLQPEATVFPKAWIQEKNDFTYVPGLAEAMIACYDSFELPRWDLSADELSAAQKS